MSDDASDYGIARGKAVSAVFSVQCYSAIENAGVIRALLNDDVEDENSEVDEN